MTTGTTAIMWISISDSDSAGDILGTVAAGTAHGEDHIGATIPGIILGIHGAGMTLGTGTAGIGIHGVAGMILGSTALVIHIGAAGMILGTIHGMDLISLTALSCLSYIGMSSIHLDTRPSAVGVAS